MISDFETCLSFDDVLIEPTYSTIRSRSDTNTSVSVGGLSLQVPLISSPMDTITGSEMAIEIGKLGGLGILHRFLSNEDRISEIDKISKAGVPLSFAVGVSKSEFHFLSRVMESYGDSVDMVCIDVANGYSVIMSDMVSSIKKSFPKLKIMAGNIACADGYTFMTELGVDAVRVGIGGGCFTASTKVLMADGSYRNINKITPGEFIINRNGKPVKVNKLINSGFKKVAKVRTNSWAESFYVTPSHRYWSSNLQDISDISKIGKASLIEKSNKNGETRVSWEEISNVKKGSTLLMPKSVNFKIPKSFTESLSNYTKNSSALDSIEISSTYDVGYAFGLFLGNGDAFLDSNDKSQIGRIKETSIADKFIGILSESFGVESSKKKEGSIINVYCYSKPLAHLFYQFGKGNSKNLPRKYWAGNEEYLKGLLDGLIDSDGHIEASGRISFYNTSEKLKELFEFICIYLGHSFSSTLKEPRNENLKDAKLENALPCYQVRIDTSNHKSDNYVYSEILEYKELSIEQETWDIEVDCDTHSFIANNSIVHNSICKTRIQTGVGIPTLHSVLMANQRRAEINASSYYGIVKTPDIIADGGIKYPSDLAKSLIAGASAVICGGAFAATIETPGEVISCEDDILRKVYRGMASAEVQNDARGGLKSGTVAEGVSTLIPCNGSVSDVLNEFKGGLRSSMTYINARTTEEFIDRADRLKRITENGIKESHAYGTRKR